MATRTAAVQSAMESTAAKAPETSAKKIVETDDVFEQIARIHNSIARRAFEIFSSSRNGFGHDLENWFKAESELLHPVHVKMTEHDGAVNLSAEVPGFDAKDLEIKLEPNSVTISGKRETNAKNARRAGPSTANTAPTKSFALSICPWSWTHRKRKRS